jgi:DNA-binding NarL/FixJ family response regulator
VLSATLNPSIIELLAHIERDSPVPSKETNLKSVLNPPDLKKSSTQLRDISVTLPRQTPGASSDADGASNSPNRKILNSWKEIANHLGRGVRTVQRYEEKFGLPVRRVAGRDRTAVMAFSDELDQWLNRASTKERRYVRPTIVVIDQAVPGTISSRKLVLEVGRFNVLTAYSVEEAFSTAERFDVDGFVLDHIPGDDIAAELCESLKERYPKKPIFAVASAALKEGEAEAVRCADHVVSGSDPQQLLNVVIAVFGTPRLE